MTFRQSTRGLLSVASQNRKLVSPAAVMWEEAKQSEQLRRTNKCSPKGELRQLRQSGGYWS
eukprot:14770109-Ditylum_brightwellii.AAC.1